MSRLCRNEWGKCWPVRPLAHVYGRVIDTSLGKGFSAFSARAAHATMKFLAFVAAPCLGIIYFQYLASARYVRLVYPCIWGEDLDAGKRPGFCGLAHGLYKLGCAVRVYGVISRVVGHHNIPEIMALSYASRYA